MSGWSMGAAAGTGSAELQRTGPDVRVTGIAAGLHVVLQFPSGQEEQDVIARAGQDKSRPGRRLGHLGIEPLSSSVAQAAPV